jgi:hypothetical protein
VLASFASRVPALALLCGDLERSGRSLDFLHVQTDASSVLQYADVTCGAPPQRTLGHLFSADAAVEYELRSPLAPRNLRLSLTAVEELRCLGRSTGGDRRGASCPTPWRGAGVGWRLPRALETLDAAELARERRVSVSAVEDRLESWTVKLEARPARAFPLDDDDDDDDNDDDDDDDDDDDNNEGGGDLDCEIGRAMLASLRDSWDAHSRVPSFELVRSLTETRGAARVKLEIIEHERGELYRRIETCLCELPLDTQWHAHGFALRRAANEVPAPTQRDLVRASWEPDLLRAFNPFLSAAGVASVRAAILDWMQLCVLKDRLARVVALLADDSPSSRDLAVRELRIRRTWDASVHPQWLALEVEGSLQIRPEQHAVIANLIAEPGRIAQLNMG